MALVHFTNDFSTVSNSLKLVTIVKRFSILILNMMAMTLSMMKSNHVFKRPFHAM